MDEFEKQLNALLVDAFNQILRLEETSLRSSLGTSITVAEAHILDVVGKHNGTITVSEIAATLKITAPTVTVALKKLERKGFVTKTACAEDARRFFIGLTRNGEKVYRVHAFFHKKMIENIGSSLTDAEKDALLSAVTKLNVFFGKK